MFDFLFEMPDYWLISANVCLAFFLFSVVPYILSRLIQIRHRPEQSLMLLNAYNAISACAGIVLAFALVEAGTTLHRIESEVSHEASEIMALDRLLSRWSCLEGATLRPTLRAYAISIVKDEWPQLRDRKRSPQTTELLRSLYSGLAVMCGRSTRDVAILNSAFYILDQMADLRDNRITASEMGLPRAFWGVIHLQIALMIILSSTLLITGGIYPSNENILGLGAYGISILVLTALVFSVDRPFKGDIAVSAQPIERAIVLMAEEIL